MGRWALGFLSAVAAAAQPLPRARAVLHQVADAYRAVQSYRVEAVVTNGPDRDQIDVAYQAPEQWRLASAERHDVTVILGTAVSHSSARATSFVSRPPGEKANSPDNIARREKEIAAFGFSDYAAIDSGSRGVRTLREESLSVDGTAVRCLVVEASYPHKLKRTFWVDAARHLVLREVDTLAGRSQRTMEVHKVTWNEPLEASLFEFTLPSGMLRSDGAVQPGPNGIVPAYPVTDCRDPGYTDEARIAHLEGAIAFNFTIDENGNPTDIKASNSLGLGLDELAEQCLSEWSYRPATKNGKPIRVRSSRSFSFNDPRPSEWHLIGVSFQPEDGASRPTFRTAAYPPPNPNRRVVGGVVVPLHLMIDRQGVPRDIQVMGNVNRGVAKEAVTMVRGWLFKPGRRDGEPAAVAASFDLAFGRVETRFVVKGRR